MSLVLLIARLLLSAPSINGQAALPWWMAKGERPEHSICTIWHAGHSMAMCIQRNHLNWSGIQRRHDPKVAFVFVFEALHFTRHWPNPRVPARLDPLRQCLRVGCPAASALAAYLR